MTNAADGVIYLISIKPAVLMVCSFDRCFRQQGMLRSEVKQDRPGFDRCGHLSYATRMARRRREVKSPQYMIKFESLTSMLGKILQNLERPSGEAATSSKARMAFRIASSFDIDLDVKKFGINPPRHIADKAA